jgi:serine/threonine protein kinase
MGWNTQVVEVCLSWSWLKARRAQIPIDEALPITKQICEAVVAAHDKGIIAT